jgi:hypothetical protein
MKGRPCVLIALWTLSSAPAGTRVVGSSVSSIEYGVAIYENSMWPCILQRQQARSGHAACPQQLCLFALHRRGTGYFLLEPGMFHSS